MCPLRNSCELECLPVCTQSIEGLRNARSDAALLVTYQVLHIRLCPSVHVPSGHGNQGMPIRHP